MVTRIFETVLRRTMILKEDGDSDDGLPGLLRTSPMRSFS